LSRRQTEIEPIHLKKLSRSELESSGESFIPFLGPFLEKNSLEKQPFDLYACILIEKFFSLNKKEKNT